MCIFEPQRKLLRKLQAKRSLHFPEVDLIALVLCFRRFVYDDRSQQCLGTDLLRGRADAPDEIPVLIKRGEIRFRYHYQTVCQSADICALKGEPAARVDNHIVISIRFLEKLEERRNRFAEGLMVQVRDSKCLRRKRIVSIQASAADQRLV